MSKNAKKCLVWWSSSINKEWNIMIKPILSVWFIHLFLSFCQIHQNLLFLLTDISKNDWVTKVLEVILHFFFLSFRAEVYWKNELSVGYIPQNLKLLYIFGLNLHLAFIY